MDQASLTGPHGIILRLQSVVKRERNIDITAAMLAGKKGMEGVLALYKPEEVVVSYPLGHTLVVTFTVATGIILLGQALSLGGHQVIVTQVDAQGVYTAIGEIAHCAKVKKSPGVSVSVPGGETIKQQATHTTSLAAANPAHECESVCRLRKELDAMTSRFEDEKRASTRLRADRDKLRSGIAQLLSS